MLNKAVDFKGMSSFVTYSGRIERNYYEKNTFGVCAAQYWGCSYVNTLFTLVYVET